MDFRGGKCERRYIELAQHHIQRPVKEKYICNPVSLTKRLNFSLELHPLPKDARTAQKRVHAHSYIDETRVQTHTSVKICNSIKG